MARESSGVLKYNCYYMPAIIFDHSGSKGGSPFDDFKFKFCGTMSWFEYLEKFSLNFSSSWFVIRVFDVFLS